MPSHSNLTEIIKCQQQNAGMKSHYNDKYQSVELSYVLLSLCSHNFLQFVNASCLAAAHILLLDYLEASTYKIISTRETGKNIFNQFRYNYAYMGKTEYTMDRINPLPLLFKALLHGQKDRVFFSGHLIYMLKQERFRAFRPVQDI
jgi:hypothetical protein